MRGGVSRGKSQSILACLACVALVVCGSSCATKTMWTRWSKTTPPADGGNDGQGGTTTVDTEVRLKDIQSSLAKVRVTQEGTKYYPNKTHRRIRVPFVYNHETGVPNRPMPWYQSLSAAGERIQLVRDLNQQVLDTDEVFIDSLGIKNQNLAMVLDRIKFQQDEAHREAAALRTALALARKKLTEVEIELGGAKSEKQKAYDQVQKSGDWADFEKQVEAQRTYNATKKAYEEAKVAYDTAKGEYDGVAAQLSAVVMASADLQRLAEDAIRNNIGQVNQRFTVFNMRPASVVASERNPVSYSITDRKFLDSLDLNQAAMVAGSIIEPGVIALGVVDSIAKRVIKKDGDTEFTYFSVPVPYNFSRPTLEGDSPVQNRVQVLVSNNGKYEFHLNGWNIDAVQDEKIDYKSCNEPTGELSAAVQADAGVYKAAIAANQNVQMAKVMSEAMKSGAQLIGAPSLTTERDEKGATITASPPANVSGDYRFVWKVTHEGGGDSVANTNAGERVEKLAISAEQFLGTKTVTVEARVSFNSMLGQPGEVTLKGVPLAAPKEVKEVDETNTDTAAFEATLDPSLDAYKEHCTFKWVLTDANGEEIDLDAIKEETGANLSLKWSDLGDRTTVSAIVRVTANKRLGEKSKPAPCSKDSGES
ncbi:MAG: hypothetical protein GY851_08795 [bacterium]|nr:hypothetical protein [bacterium]